MDQQVFLQTKTFNRFNPRRAQNTTYWTKIPIECFHSRGQHLWEFFGTKESVCIRKEFNSHRIVLVDQHGPRFIVLGHQYGRRDVMWKHSTSFCKLLKNNNNNNNNKVLHEGTAKKVSFERSHQIILSETRFYVSLFTKFLWESFFLINSLLVI